MLRDVGEIAEACNDSQKDKTPVEESQLGRQAVERLVG